MYHFVIQATRSNVLIWTLTNKPYFYLFSFWLFCRLGLQPTNIQTTAKQGIPFYWFVLLWLYVCKNFKYMVNSTGCFQPVQAVFKPVFNHIFTMLLFSCNIVKNNPNFNRFLRSQRKHFVLWFNTFRTPVKAWTTNQKNHVKTWKCSILSKN